MASNSHQAGYIALAEFRYRIRHFLNASERAARSAALEPEQYQLLLAVRGMPRGQSPTIQALAERLQVKHNTAVERVDRLAKLGLVHRVRGRSDRRVVIVGLTARGNRVFERLARMRLQELRQVGPELVAALGDVVEATRRLGSARRKN
jgi:DNA-binding MarR family transcriptional regulator